MAELKGVEELNEVIEQFFVELGYDEIECSLDLDFAYYVGTDEITYSLFQMEEADEGFRQYLNKVYPNIPECSLFVISLLHELGHHITIPQYSKENFEAWSIVKKLLEKQKADTPKEKIEKQIKYCSLFDEAIATKTAVDILIAEYDFIHSYEEKIFKAILKFYEINQIEG